jgi:hypothetical protein
MDKQQSNEAIELVENKKCSPPKKDEKIVSLPGYFSESEKFPEDKKNNEAIGWVENEKCSPQKK